MDAALYSDWSNEKRDSLAHFDVLFNSARVRLQLGSPNRTNVEPSTAGSSYETARPAPKVNCTLASHYDRIL